MIGHCRLVGDGTGIPAPLEVYDTDDEDMGGTSDLAKWIGQGKDWNCALPTAIYQACRRASRVPDAAIRTLLPSPSISVADALEFKFIHPTPSPAPPEYSMSDRPNVLTDNPDAVEFSNTLLNLCRDAFSEALPHVSSLRRQFRNHWLSGARSIIIPRAPAFRFPLWVEALLSDLERASHKHQKWTQASFWLQGKLSATQDSVLIDVIEACRIRFHAIAWDTPVPSLDGSSLSPHDLATFLSNDWLNDDMLDAGSAYIMRNLTPGLRVRIMGCHFMDYLRSERDRAQNIDYIPSHPIQHSALITAIRNGDIDILEVPVNPGRNHWAGIRVDLTRCSFSYRDGLNPHATASTTDLELLSWYLQLSENANLKRLSFPFSSSTISTPRQINGHSCGIVYLSSLAADYLGHPAWTQSGSAMGRIKWFLRLSEPLIHDSDILFSATTGHLKLIDTDSATLSQQDTSHPDLPTTPSILTTLSGPLIELSPLRKRAYTAVSVDSEDHGLDHNIDHRSLQVRTGDGSAPDSSWSRQKALKKRATEPSFISHPGRFQSFRNKVLCDEPNAEFNNKDPRSVFCPACAVWIKMRVLYDCKRWKEHRSSSKCLQNRSTRLKSKSLFSFLTPIPKSSPSRAISCPVPPLLSHLCGGLPREEDPKIDAYFLRSSASGGGAPARLQITYELFPDRDKGDCTWANLSRAQQKMVLTREHALYKWRNDRNVGAVFSTRCNGTAILLASGDVPLPCANCQALRKLHTFQNILNRKMPDEENMKFVPKGYRCHDLGTIYLKYKGVRKLIEDNDGQTPWLRFAKGAAAGVYKSQSVLLGMVEAMVKKSERALQGKSLRNMQYTEGFDSFCSLLASTSTRAYKTFQNQFGGRGIRSMQALRAKMPRFEPGFSENNIREAAASIARLNYHGPLALSWDDTDLEKALTAWQESKDSWVILGATQGPIRVSSVDDIDNVFRKAQLQMAEKLRVWILTIPLPKIPPILIAAVARSSTDTSESLAQMHFKLSEMMHAVGLHAVSAAADGTETERGAQRIIVASAQSVFLYGIPNDVPGCTLEYSIPLFHNRPMVAVQDSKHGAKTAQNQLFSGARLLALGNFPMYYKMLFDITDHPLGPLFRRDVERVDKQDDRAAARLFSAENIEFSLRHFPTRPALSIYLFALGELVDAWQNRNITHATRAQMVMRARFFLMAWRNHVLQHSDHDIHINFISRESYDIFITLCDSLLQLVLVYRKYYPTYPLLPWLHSTEPCEHIFGLLRQLKNDFNYADVLLLERKLRVLMFGAFQHLSTEEQANQLAAGYHHTYFHAPDLNTMALMTWPTDAELRTASGHAFREAEELLSAVGIDARSMLSSYTPPEPPKTKGMPIKKPRHPQTLFELLQLYSVAPLTPTLEDQVETCEMALAADDADKTLSIMNLPDSSPMDEKMIATEVEMHRQAADGAILQMASTSDPLLLVVPSLTALNISSFVKPTTLTLETNNLVVIRQQHQPRSTSKAVRQVARLTNVMHQVQSVSPIDSPSSATDIELSVREALIKRLANLVPDVQNTTSGANRKIRHTGIFAMENSKTSARGMQTATVQNVAALVSNF
ncbi:hypothetical protein BJ138DRAFT_1114345 [Hygrophoropsis aurantiaca]|uniref:Uncharacterized protein n=1 Tax=Hygrophoropsis aurantiaca TaxID=72124 RepID=A0ACB8A9K6_9AGAM|nr:hypothetical protein BJ138DRAFT_1114345 [Hygrophoropsis aurantiaca]